MAKLLKSTRDWHTRANLEEWLIKDAADLANVGDTAGPGSTASTADMSIIARKDEDGNWKAINGEIPEEETEE